MLREASAEIFTWALSDSTGFLAHVHVD